MNAVRDPACDGAVNGRYFSELDEELPSAQARDDDLACELERQRLNR